METPAERKSRLENEAFESWWKVKSKSRSVKGSTPERRRTARRWAKIGWDAHIADLVRQEEEDRQHMAEMVAEYTRQGCPPGFWGDFS